MADAIYIEIETAIRRINWATAQVGQKSLQRITVDFASHNISSQYLTGKTKIVFLELSSIRDSFQLIRPRFNTMGTAFFSVHGETASAVVIMPNINYEFDFEISPTEVKFSGKHDGYPSYNIAANGASAYDYVQGHLGQLLGDSDVTVRTRTFAIR